MEVRLGGRGGQSSLGRGRETSAGCQVRCSVLHLTRDSHWPERRERGGGGDPWSLDSCLTSQRS